MRLYHRLGHLAYKRLVRRWDRDIMAWAMRLQPGEVFGACTGYNHILAEKPVAHRYRHRNGWYVNEVQLIDTTGRWHWCPGGGCVCQPYTVKEIHEFFASFGESPWVEDDAHLLHLIKVIRAGTLITDERGVMLPEFAAKGDTCPV